MNACGACLLLQSARCFAHTDYRFNDRVSERVRESHWFLFRFFFLFFWIGCFCACICTKPKERKKEIKFHFKKSREWVLFSNAFSMDEVGKMVGKMISVNRARTLLNMSYLAISPRQFNCMRFVCIEQCRKLSERECKCVKKTSIVHFPKHIFPSHELSMAWFSVAVVGRHKVRLKKKTFKSDWHRILRWHFFLSLWLFSSFSLTLNTPVRMLQL